MNPVVVHEQPDADLVEAYRPVRAASDAAAAAVLGDFSVQERSLSESHGTLKPN